MNAPITEQAQAKAQAALEAVDAEGQKKWVFADHSGSFSALRVNG